jgi:hypothetical protein
VKGDLDRRRHLPKVRVGDDETAGGRSGHGPKLETEPRGRKPLSHLTFPIARRILPHHDRNAR